MSSRINNYIIKPKKRIDNRVIKPKRPIVKAAQTAMICAAVIAFSFYSSPAANFFDYILWEVMAFHSEAAAYDRTAFFESATVRDTEEVVITPNSEHLRLVSIEYMTELRVIGLDDIIFQDYDEFRPLVNESFNQNFTLQNLDIERFSNDRNFFISSFYNIDSNTGIIRELFDPIRFLNTDLTLEKNYFAPQVLIFHVHGGTEFFVDSDTTDLSQGVIGAGERLKYILENKYGLGVIHITDVFDVIDGVSARGGSYERAEAVIEQVLRDNPTIEVVLDLHRDGIEPNPNLVTYFDGKPHARLMFVNGVSALEQNGEIRRLNNLRNYNLEDNLAFSFNMQLAANEMFPGLMRRKLLKPFRYSTHMEGRSLLVEIGSQHSTMEEAFNSMELLADILYAVVFK